MYIYFSTPIFLYKMVSLSYSINSDRIFGENCVQSFVGDYSVLKYCTII